MKDLGTGSIDGGVAAMEADERDMIDRVSKMMEAHGRAVYPLDFYALGALNRAFNLSLGFRALVAPRNFYCIGAILRLHLDTALRFSAAFVVTDPHDFATRVQKGEQVRAMCDRDGNRLTDRQLVRTVATEFPWIEDHYEKTSGYVHMSDVHVRSIFNKVDKPGTFNITVGDRGPDIPDEALTTAIHAFRASTQILLWYIDGWIYTKDNPEEATGKNDVGTEA